MSGVLVVGQIARDLVLLVDDVPAPQGSVAVRRRSEVLGGKGANQAVGLRQLGNEVALVGVAGTDPAGDLVLDRARADGIDVSAATRRGRTALLVDVVTGDGVRRLLEDVPDSALTRVGDLEPAERLLRTVDTVCLQLQQPADTLLAAARFARSAGARVVLDGGLEGPRRDELLAGADVVRADAAEIEQWTGAAVRTETDARRASGELLAAGAAVVACTVAGEGDLVAWSGDAAFFPYGDAEIVDSTGAGDAFVAGLVTGLRQGDSPAAAGRLAAACAAATVTRLGGRPDLCKPGRESGYGQ